MMASPRPVALSLQEYARGIAGGLIFSLPLLFTQEMWQLGFSIPPLRLLLGLLVCAVLLLGYNRFVGLRPDSSWREVAIDSVEELGLGLVLATLLLWVLGRIEPGMSAGEVMSQIVLCAMSVAIGVSVGTAQLGGQGNSGDDENEDEAQDENGGGAAKDAASEQQDETPFAAQITIAACGALIFAANVAPTEEIVLLGVENPPSRLLILALLSLSLVALVLYFSDFKGAQQLSQSSGPFSILMGTLLTYAIALLVSAATLWFFGRFDHESVAAIVAQTVVLGFAASLGASAGRLLLQAPS